MGSPRCAYQCTGNPDIRSSADHYQFGQRNDAQPDVPERAGPQYVLEWKGELTNGVWTAMSTNAGTGLPISVGASMLTPPQRFFRVRMQ